MLLQEIEYIFNGSQNASRQEEFVDSLRRFHVGDIGVDGDRSSVVLLVESPHTHEVGYGFPLAGNTGVHVRNVIDKCAIDLAGQNAASVELPRGPMGRLVHDRRPEVDGLGIMNVSRLPFQDDAYNCLPWSKHSYDCRNHGNWRKYIEHMSKIKNHPCRRRRRNVERRKLDEAIAKDLRERLILLNRNVLLVRCGKVSIGFYKKAERLGNIGIREENIINMPHPSRERWRHEKLNSTEKAHLRRVARAIAFGDSWWGM